MRKVAELEERLKEKETAFVNFQVKYNKFLIANKTKIFAYNILA